VHEPKYSSTQPSNEFATGAHLSSDIENELGKAVLPSSPRTGYLGYEMITAIESLLYHYGVDLVLTGHEHNYERSYPVYMDKVSTVCLSGCVCRIFRLSVCTCWCQVFKCVFAAWLTPIMCGCQSLRIFVLALLCLCDVACCS